MLLLPDETAAEAAARRDDWMFGPQDCDLTETTVNPGASPCSHPPFCSCPTPDATPRLAALAANWDAEIARVNQ